MCLGIPTYKPSDLAPHVLPQLHFACDRDQRGATLLGPAFRRAYVVRQCSCNAVNALVNRHLAPAPRPKCVPRFSRALANAIRDVYRDLLPGSGQRWCDKWPAGKLARIKQSRLNDPVRPSLVDLLVKLEVAHAFVTKGRGIQMYPNLATQAAVGPQQSCFQKALCDVCGGRTDVRGFELYPGIFVAVASGWDVARFGEWATVASQYAHVYERDGKAWDATMSVPLLLCKLRYMSAASRELADFVRRGIICRGKYRGHGDQAVRFYYTSVGTVKSGHNDTTSGNSLLNFLICADSCRRLGVRANILVVGDDLIAFVEKKCNLAETESEYGIRPEARWFRDITQASFISGVWCWDGRRYAFGPTPGRLLARLWWTVAPPSRRRLADYRHGVASGLLSTFPTHPIVQSLVGNALRRSRETCVPKWQTFTGTAVEFDWHAGLAYRYGVTPQVIAQWADYVAAAADAGPGVYEEGPLAWMFDVDLADLPNRPT